MRIAILGFPLSGKTTLFNVLAKAHAQTGTFASAAGGLNVGTISVPDHRLEKLRDLYRPKKYTPARVEYVDFAGVLSSGKDGAAALVPPQLRDAELIVACIRAFRDPAVPHPFDTVDPVRDLKRFGDELLLKDLEIIENRLGRIEKNVKVGAGRAEPQEVDLLRKCRSALEAENPLRGVELTADERRRIKGFQFLTAKPLLAVVNIDESDLPSGPLGLGEITRSPGKGAGALCVAAKTEMELATLEGLECEEFMALLGIEESSLDRLIRASYELLGTCSFFTVGPDEVRAWTIEAGTRAVDAAGVIHSDLARGFIRAEVARWDELLEAGGLSELKEKGRLRLEGKDYPVQDGDVLHVRFSV